MKADISIDSLGIGVYVAHADSRRKPETIHLQVHRNGVLIWDDGCQLCSSGYSFGEIQSGWMRTPISEMPHLDEVYRALLDHSLANRGNLVGEHLDPGVSAMESAIAVRDGSSVYFADAGGQVKIGWSKKISTRLAQLQTGSAFPIKLLGTMPGGRAAERRLHERFAHLRLSGEWFTAAPELLTFIAAEATP